MPSGEVNLTPDELESAAKRHSAARSPRSGREAPSPEVQEAVVGRGWAGRSDAQLVHEVRNGQIDAFGELVRRYERRLQRTIYRLVNDAEWARDLAQETFLRVFERLEQFDTSRRFGPWLFRIGVNLAVDQWRRRRHRPLVVLADVNANPAVPQREDPRPAQETAEEVHVVLEQLASADRTVLALRDLEGFTCAEIAGILGRREATIRWRLCKARERFRRIWEARQQEAELVRSPS